MIDAPQAPALPDVGSAPASQDSSPSTGSPNRRAVLTAAGVALATAACVPAGTAPAPTTSAPITTPPLDRGASRPPETAPVTSAPTTTAPAPSTTVPGPPGAAPLNARLLVDKLTFGPKPGLVAAIEAQGLWTWIEGQLDPVGRNIAHAESRVAGYVTLTNSHRQNYSVQETDGGYDRLILELDHATMQRAVYSDRQLYELMCDFWTNHFNTWRQKTWMAFLKNRSHETVVRPHALGKFSDMLLASAQDTAMLDYLDNTGSDASVPGGVNENYGREILELHTLGILGGVQPYTEADVRGVARTLSGWSIKWEDAPNRYGFDFRPWMHSRDAVSILGGAFTSPARTYGQGLDDGVRLVNVLAHHPATARHIATKLCRRFVSDAPSDALVSSTAAVFTANDTAIVPTLRHIFASAEFAQSARSKVRRPFEHVVATLRATNAAVAVNPLGEASQKLHELMERVGQPLYERHSPDGYPDANSFWTSSEGLLQRWAASARITRNGLTDNSKPDKVVVNLAALLPNPAPATVASLLAWMAENLANYTLSAGDIAELCTACSFNGSSAATTITGNGNNLALAVGLVLAHPTFQKR